MLRGLAVSRRPDLQALADRIAADEAALGLAHKEYCPDVEVTAAYDSIMGNGPARDLAPTTIATLLSRLERRGVVSHTTQGRQYVYRARVSEGEVRRSMVSGLTDLLFGGDVAALMTHLLDVGSVRPGDLEKVRTLIAEAEGRSGKRGGR